MRKLIVLFTFLFSITLVSQESSIEGHVTNQDNIPLSFVSVLLFEEGQPEPIQGAITENDGYFLIEELENKSYTITFNFLGYNTVASDLTLSGNTNLGNIVLEESTETLEEAVIKVRSPSITKSSGKLIFNVENTTLSSGDTHTLLSKTPGVLIIGDRVSIKNTATTIYINDKRVYLSPTELNSFLKSLDASIVKEVEVITIPSAKYDAESGSMLNIITTKPVTIGYKGSLNGRWEQAVYPKFHFGTSHYYKSDKINFYGSYSYIPRKEYKEQFDEIVLFKPNNNIKSFWDTEFNRTTRSNVHQGNLIMDFNLNDKSSLSLTSHINISPDKKFNNNDISQLYNPQRQLDSTFTTKSELKNTTSNVNLGVDYSTEIGKQGSKISLSSNYIIYRSDQDQFVNTVYRTSNGDLIRNSNFLTESIQDTDIFTGQFTYSAPFSRGNFETGVKYSNIETTSGLDFFNVSGNSSQLDPNRSDLFNYNEAIYAIYATYSKEWDSWKLNAGIRGEYTDVEGISRSLGEVNTQEYFEIFPTTQIEKKINDNNTIGISYVRRLERPRYQSLNPFRYFLNEHNYNGGNPNLVPGIDNKIMLSYNYKNKLFLDAYYVDSKDRLSILTYQDNETNSLRNIDANLISEIQYSFDATFVSTFLKWWYVSAYTSTFYMENEFLALESVQDTYSNSAFGFFSQIYNNLTLSKDKSITSDVTLYYLSNIIYGSYDYKDQFSLSFSMRKELWDKRASITIGVDDIFDTYNVPVVSRYYNQNNSYFSQPESRFFKLGFIYSFGNTKLGDNSRDTKSKESDRLD
jgi:hypothetical protein